MFKECFCGSGLERFELTDARGIFCAFVCDSCEAEKRSRYRVEIFESPSYEADEPFEDDY